MCVCVCACMRVGHDLHVKIHMLHPLPYKVSNMYGEVKEHSLLRREMIAIVDLSTKTHVNGGRCGNQPNGIRYLGNRRREHSTVCACICTTVHIHLKRVNTFTSYTHKPCLSNVVFLLYCHGNMCFHATLTQANPSMSPVNVKVLVNVLVLVSVVELTLRLDGGSIVMVTPVRALCF